MKQAISVLCALVILTSGAYAQNPGPRRGGDILRMVGIAKSGHPGGSMSSTDILTTLY